MRTPGFAPKFGAHALRIVIVGHVDHGKSTLVGRLLHDTGSLPEGKFEQIQAVCRRRGMPFEWAFLMDSLQAERDQNITIDVSQIWFRSETRSYVIIDAPGHKEFLKNMVTGAASAGAALLLIAANEGVQEQSKRHAYLLSMLGVNQVLVLVNKMDLVDYSESIFLQIEKEYREFLERLGIQPVRFIPISARDGLNLVEPSNEVASWYSGPTLLRALDRLPVPNAESNGPLRFAVQDVYRFDERRIIAGRIESGTLRVGDHIVFSPNHKTSSVASIERWNAPLKDTASAGESVGLILTEPIFIERGHIGSHETDVPIEAKRFRARIFWMGDKPFSIGKRYNVKLLTQEIECQLVSVDRGIDATSLETVAGLRLSVAKNEVAEVTIQARSPLVMDNHDKVDTSGRFVVVDERDVAGGGIIFGGAYIERERIHSTNLFWSEGRIDQRVRMERNGHRGTVIWLTGLSGAGKSTLARALETNLFHRHMQVYVLDGDNIRHGLNSNLGFTPDDRVENIRRVAEVAKLMADAGLVVITSLISPYRLDRTRARNAILNGDVEFIEVYVAAPLQVCERRDPKNLYKRARSGEIKDFTGIDAPYEEPENPEITIHTDRESVKESVGRLLDFLIPRLQLDLAEYEI
ncbi:MAG: adenylyl-sulfate kinase [Verrucomicrobia bacterium]|nr:adenylyl-sulfate kinase [Verrucomicrobiota bacterium]